MLKLFFHHRYFPEMLNLRTLNRRTQRGAQPENIQAKGGFEELDNFNKHFVKNTQISSYLFSVIEQPLRGAVIIQVFCKKMLCAITVVHFQFYQIIFLTFP